MTNIRVTNLWTSLIEIRAARRNQVKDWSVKLQIHPNSDHAFSMIPPSPWRTYPAHRMPLHPAVLSKCEVCSGLVCGRRHGYDAALRLVCSTELTLRSSTFWRRIRFLSKLIKKRNIEHENWVSERSFCDSPHWFQSKPPTSRNWYITYWQDTMYMCSQIMRPIVSSVQGFIKGECTEMPSWSWL